MTALVLTPLLSLQLNAVRLETIIEYIQVNHLWARGLRGWPLSQEVDRQVGRSEGWVLQGDT